MYCKHKEKAKRRSDNDEHSIRGKRREDFGASDERPRAAYRDAGDECCPREEKERNVEEREAVRLDLDRNVREENA